MRVLATNELARYSQMRPKNIDSNLYAYHLRVLQNSGYIIKDGGGYTLTAKGLSYIDKTTDVDRLNIRQQPKITTTVIVKDKSSKLLLTKRHKQPFINYWNFPTGKIHLSDQSIVDAAKREVWEKPILQ